MIRPETGCSVGKIVTLHGQSPGGWKRERWDWRKGVVRSPALSWAAKCLANELAFGFANADTAECRPGLQTLMDALGMSRATVFRALADLSEAGWLARKGGNAPGKHASYLFTTPKQVSGMRPEHVSHLRPEQVSELQPEQVSLLGPTGLSSAIPPTPPYKDQPNMNQTPRQILRGKPRPKCVCIPVAIDSAGAAAWDDWLKGEGFPPLAKIGRKISGPDGEAFDLPGRYPPSTGDETGNRIARSFADWLRSIA